MQGRTALVVSVLIILAHTAFTVFLSARLNMWIDESYTMHTSSGSLIDAARSAFRFELQPPVYFVSVTAWRALNESLFVGRLFSVLCVTLALIATYGLSRRYFPAISPAWLVGAFAINPMFLYAATELRVYGMLLLWIVLLFNTFYDGYLADTPSKLARVANAVTALLAVATHYYAGFLLPALAVGLLVTRRWRSLFVYLLFMAGVGVTFAPIFFVSLAHVDSISKHIADGTSPQRALVHVGARLFGLPLGLQEYESPIRQVGMMLAGVGAVTATLVFRRRAAEITAFLWVVAAVVVAFYVFVTSFVLFEQHMLPRHLIVLLVPGMLLVLSALYLFGPHRKRAISIFAVLFLAIVGGADVLRFAPLAKSGDYIRVANYIEANELADEPVFVVIADAAVPLAYHYNGKNSIVPLPQPQNFERYDISLWVIDTREMAKGLLTAHLDPGDTFWMFFDRPANASFLGLDLQLANLDEALADPAFTYIDERRFHDAWLRRYEYAPEKAADSFRATSLTTN